MHFILTFKIGHVNNVGFYACCESEILGHTDSLIMLKYLTRMVMMCMQEMGTWHHVAYCTPPSNWDLFDITTLTVGKSTYIRKISEKNTSGHR